VGDTHLEGFETWLMEKGRSPFTCRGYSRDIKAFSRWLEVERDFRPKLENISAEDVEAYREHLLKQKKASPRTFNRGLAAIRAYLDWAREEGCLTGDPIREMRLFPEDRNIPRWLEINEIKAMTRVSKERIRTAKTPAAQHIARRDHALLTLLIDTGMRLSELTMLDLSDIDLTRKKSIVVVGKGACAKPRSIALDASTRNALLSWLEVRPKEGSEAVFTDMWNGDRLGRAALERRIKKIGKKAKVNVTIYTIRHSVARRMIEAGSTMVEVAGHLGIRDVYYAARTYRTMRCKKRSEGGNHST